jgi:hypothetical protein
MTVVKDADMKTRPMQRSRRDLFGLSAAAGITALLDAPRSARAEQAATQNPLLVIDVKRFDAQGDGVKDDTASFQRALDAAHAQGGGAVYAPPGRYIFKGPLNVPVGVTLRGSFSCVPSHTGLRDRGQAKPGDDGTALYVTAGHGTEDGTPFLTLNTNSSVCGLTIYYPEQIPDGEPVAYPWTIAMRGKNPAVFDLELLNPYQGIDASQNERHNIRNVTGQPLRRGIWVDAIYDIGRIENVHFNPWWSNHRDLHAWQIAHGEAFIFGRSDWEYVFNTFCFAYRVGYRFVETATGGCNGNFLGIGADDCNRAIVVEQAAEFGLLVTNGEFTSFHGDDPTMIEVSDKNRGVLRVSNSAFWGPCNQIARIGGTGTVGFSDCTFVEWGHAGDRAAIQAASGTLLVQGCEFRRDLKHISLGSGVDRAIISGNLFTGPARVDNASNGDVQIGLNSAASRK